MSRWWPGPLLKAEAIVETLVGGCEQGSFVLRLTRPDGSFRTWWRSRPDDTALKDPALELVLPEAAQLGEVSPDLLVPKALPGLWQGDEISVQSVIDYFSGGRVIKIDRGGYEEAVQIPRGTQQVVEKATAIAVENGSLWLLSGPASILGEPIPAGVLTPLAKLSKPPDIIPAAEILPENLPAAWQYEQTTALAISSALSQKASKVLPWKTVRDVITSSLQARFTELLEGSDKWPCDFPAAQSVRLGVAKASVGDKKTKETKSPNLVAAAYLEPSQIQDLGELMPKLLEIKTKSQVPMRFRVEVEVGDGEKQPPKDVAPKVLAEISDGLQLR